MEFHGINLVFIASFPITGHHWIPQKNLSPSSLFSLIPSVDDRQEQHAQRSWEALIGIFMGSFQGHVGQGFKQLDLVKHVPDVGKGVGLDNL